MSITVWQNARALEYELLGRGAYLKLITKNSYKQRLKKISSTLMNEV